MRLCSDSLEIRQPSCAESLERGDTAGGDGALFSSPFGIEAVAGSLMGAQRQYREGEEEFHMALEAENLSTWFTVPLKEREKKRLDSVSSVFAILFR